MDSFSAGEKLNTDRTCQEILLFANNWLKNKTLDGNSDTTWAPTELLQKASRMTWFLSLLQELSILSVNDQVEDWYAMPGEHFLRLSIGPFGPLLENHQSIDPYFFLPLILIN